MGGSTPHILYHVGGLGMTPQSGREVCVPLLAGVGRAGRDCRAERGSPTQTMVRRQGYVPAH